MEEHLLQSNHSALVNGRSKLCKVTYIQLSILPS